LTCPRKTDPHVKLERWIEGRQRDEQEALYAGAESPPLNLSISALFPLLHAEINCFDILSIAAFRSARKSWVTLKSSMYNFSVKSLGPFGMGG
jgi:hypothetical protein